MSHREQKLVRHMESSIKSRIFALKFSLMLLLLSTRYSNNCSTLIGSIIIKSQSHHCSSGILLSDVSDHSPIMPLSARVNEKSIRTINESNLHTNNQRSAAEKSESLYAFGHFDEFIICSMMN